jgi:hypothetical protein
MVGDLWPSIFATATLNNFLIVPFSVPVAAASQIVISRWQAAHHSIRAWAYRISIKKVSPAPVLSLTDVIYKLKGKVPFIFNQ